MFDDAFAENSSEVVDLMGIREIAHSVFSNCGHGSVWMHDTTPQIRYHGGNKEVISR